MPQRQFGQLVWYAVAALAVAVAIGGRLFLDPVVGEQFPFATLFVAVTATALFCGFGPALFSVAFGTMAAAYFLLPPRGSFRVAGQDQQIGLLLYVLVGTGIAVLGGVVRVARAKSASEAAIAHEQREL